MNNQRMGIVLVVLAICVLAVRVQMPESIIAIVLALIGGYLIDER